MVPANAMHVHIMVPSLTSGQFTMNCKSATGEQQLLRERGRGKTTGDLNTIWMLPPITNNEASAKCTRSQFSQHSERLQRAHQTIFMILLGLLPCLLLCPHFWPLFLVGKALINIHQKNDSDLHGFQKPIHLRVLGMTGSRVTTHVEKALQIHCSP